MLGRQERVLQNTIREIMNLAGSPKPRLRDAQDYFSSFCRLDYVCALGRQFDRGQLTQLLGEFRSALPTLNREVFAITDLRRLAEIASDMGVTLQTNAFQGRVGRALRGFYVSDRELLRQPLICLNTANHPVVVAASFWHEVGHHLTSRVFDIQQHQPSLTFNTNYQDHLDDPREIAADTLMVLACYPKPAAKCLFGLPERDKANEDADPLISKALPYVRSVTGFDFERQTSARENLHYLAGIIHVAKLRAALLAGYGI